MDNSIEVLQKIKNGTAISSSNSTFAYMPKGNKNKISKRYIPPMFSAALFIKAKDMETTCQGMNGKGDVYTYTLIYIIEYYSAMRKNFFHSWQHRPWGHYTKWDKSYKDIYCMMPLICGI